MIRNLTLQEIQFKKKDKSSVISIYFYDISFYSQQMVCLTSEEDSKWKKMRYLPITKVLEHFEHEHKRELK